MKKNNFVIYFLTENIDIEKEKNEIEYLQKAGKVVLISDNFQKTQNPLGLKRIFLKPLSPFLIKFIILWSKICFFLAKIGDTSSDREFTVRNVYTGNKFVRFFINSTWRFKVLSCINSRLPSYDALYFFPFNIYYKILCKKKKESEYTRILVHDSLVFRLNKFPMIVVHARENDITTLANIKSWDNPFYSQLAVGASGFLAWSESMWNDVQKVHGLKNKFVHIWGARPFFRYHQGLKSFLLQNPSKPEPQNDGKFVIGYAAAFCDEYMGRHEVELIKVIAKNLQKSLPDFTIMFRPYPILPLSFYADLESFSNIKLVGIAGIATQYNDGKKIHQFHIGSDRERFSFLSRCDCFLSIATSFTIEAAMFEVPIVHFYLAPGATDIFSEYEFFTRIVISDHIMEYFKNELVFADNYKDLVGQIDFVIKNRDVAIKKSNMLLTRMGIPLISDGHWPDPSLSLKDDLLRSSNTFRGDSS